MSRQRMTWRGRRASPPPATPGYGSENTGHPASQPDPSHEEYASGDPSAWAEDVHPPPYEQSAPPAVPGYDEAGDHPAAKKASIKDLIHRRAAKCLKIASAMLGPNAKSAALDDQALDLMDLDDAMLESTYRRVTGGKQGDFLACGPMGMDDYPEDVGSQNDGMNAMDEEEDMLAQMLDEDVMDEPMMDEPMMDEPMGMMHGQDDMDMYGGGMDEMFGKFASAVGFDSNGFITEADWKGDKAIFAALDEDEDGIISIREFQASLQGTGAPTDGYGDLDAEERRMLQAMEKEAEEDEEGDDEEEEDKEAKKAAIRRRRRRSAKKAEEDEEAEEEGDDEGDDEDKEAKTAQDELGMVFANDMDPMGLGGGPDMTPEESRVLTEIFEGKTAAEEEGEEEEAEEEEAEEEDEKEAKKAARRRRARRNAKKAQDDEEDEEDDDEEEEKEAKKASRRSKAASLRPKARKPSKGVRALGAVTKTAGAGKDEVQELSDLWKTSPDISEHL